MNPKDENESHLKPISQFFNKEQIEINMVYKIKDYIRNYRPLSDAQLSHVVKLSDEQKNEIIQLYNHMFIHLESVLEELT